MKTHLPVALRKALIAAIFAVSAFAYNKASAETESPSVGGTTALEVTVTGNNETYSHSGDINVAPMDSVAGYDALKITAGDKENGVSGSITVESAPSTLYNADFRAEGDITIGGDNNKSQMLVIRGSGSTEIEATGDIYFKLRVDAAVGQDQNTGNETSGGREERGSMRIHADGDIVFDSVTPGDALNRQVRFAGGETDNDKAVLSAGGSIKVKDMGSCTLAWTRHSTVTSGKDITITLPYSDGLFSGAVNAGTTFSFGGANFSIYDVRDDAPTLTAGEGISVATNGMNYGYHAIMTATSGDITLVSSSSSSNSNIYYSVTATAKNGNISVQSANGRAYMDDCVVKSETGDISVTGKKVEAEETSYTAVEHLILSGASLTGLADVVAEADSMVIGAETGDTNITSKSESEDVHSSFTATGNIEVNGSRVNISDATAIRSEDGSVSIVASGEYAEDPKTQRPFGGVNIRESEVEAQGDISITGASVTMTDALAVSRGKNTIGGSVETSIKGVDVDGGSLAIGTSTGTTSLGSSTDAGAVTAYTTLDATGKIAVTGKTVSITGVSVDSTGTDADGVSVAITGSDVDVSGENVTGSGSVTIAGTDSTAVNGVDVDGASISVGSETGTTTITNTDDKDTTLDAAGKIAVTGTTVSLTDISVDSTGTDADGVSVAITGSDVEVSGENVTGKGSVTIAGTTGTKVNDVDVDGASIAVGSETGATTITNTDDEDTTLDATGKIAVTGTTVSLTDISVDSTGTDADGVSVAITGSDVEVSGENVTGTGSVTIAGTTGTKVNGVDVDGASIAVGSETGATTITNTDDEDTTLDATGKIAVTGTTVSLTDISVDSTGTDADGVSVAITGSDVEVSGENVTGTGSVTIAGTTGTKVNGVDVDGASIAVGSETGATTITNTDDKDTTLDAAGKIAVTGTTVSLTDISVDSTGTDADGVSVAITGSDVKVSGENVTGMGAVNIVGTNSATLENVVVGGQTASITGGEVRVTGESVKGTDSVTIAGTTSTTIENVDVKESATATIGSDTATGQTSLSNSGVAVEGEVAIAGGSVNITGNERISSETGSVKITATAGAASIAGGAVTAEAGAVEVSGASQTTLENVVVDGKTASITGGEVSVTGESVTGTDSVTIAGTTSTTIENVDVKESATATIGSDTATGQTSLSNSGVAVEGEVAIAGGSVNITGNEGISSETGSVKITATAGAASITGGAVTAEAGAVAVSGASQTTLDNVVVSGQTASITGGEVSVTGESVTGTDSVTIAGTTSTTIENVDVKESATATIGSDTATGQTSLSNSGVAVEGEVAIAGGSVNITGNEGISSETGSVKITATAGAASIAGGAVTAKAGAVEVSGTSQTTLDNVAVDGNTVSLGNVDSATSITGGTIDGKGDVSVYGTELTVKDGVSIDSQDGKVTVSGATTEITGGNVTSKTGDIDIIGSTTNTLSGVSVGGKEVSVTGGAVSVTGGTVAGSAAVAIAGTTSTKVNGVDVDGKTVAVGDAGSVTTITGGTIDGNGDVSVYGSDLTVKDAVSIDSLDGKVTVSGATTGITGGNVTSKTGDVEIIGSTTNTLSGVSVGGKDVNVTGGAVSVTGGTVAGSEAVTIAGSTSTEVNGVDVDGKTIDVGAANSGTTISGGTIDGAAGVKVNGATVFVNNNAAIKAKDGDVSLNAGTVNYVDSGTSITAESGGVTIALAPATGAVNIVTGAIVENDIIVSTAPVSITAGGGALVIDGGVSGDNLIDYTTMTAAGTAGSITIKGKTNAIGAAVTLQAATGITVSSLGTDALSGNKVDASTLVSAEGDIALDANYANHVSNGTVINAESGGVKIALTSDSGFANIVSGATDTAPNPVSITAGDGAILIDGGAMGENLVEYASLEALGQDGSITIQGEANGIGASTTLKAAKDVNITSDGVDADDGNFIEASTITSVGGSVNILAANYTQMDKSSLSASAGVKITSTGTAAEDGNEIDYSTIETETGDVTMTANGVNFVEGSQLTAKTGEVALQGGSNVLEKDTKLQASKGVSVISTGTGIQDGNLISASTLQTSNNDVKIAAEGINLLNATKATTDNGSVLLTGSSNVVQNSSAVQATSGITVTAEGDGAGRGNQIAASTLTSTDGDIAIDANYANHVTNGAVINAESGGVKIALTSDSGFVNIVSGATDTAPNPVSITAGDGALMIDGGDSGENLVEYATLTAAGTDGRITIQGKANGVGAGATLLADKGVNIVSTGTDTDASDSSFDGNLVHASSITAKEGNVAVDAKSINRVIDADLVASAGAVDVSGYTNLVQAESTIQASADISVTSTGDAAGSGNYLEHSSLKTSAGSVEISAEQSNVVSNGSTVHANQDIDIISRGTGDNRGNVIKSSTLESDAGDVRLTAANINQVEASKITASGGAVELNGDSNLIYNGVTVQAAAGVSMTSSGVDAKDGNQVSNSTVKTSDGDVVMTSNQFNAVINADISTGYMEGKGDIIIGDEGGSTETVTNGIVATEGHNTSIFAGRDVRIAGSNVIMGSNFGAVTIAAAQGDITLRDDNDITCAVIDAAGTDGDVAITTGTGDKGTTITNSGLYGQTVTIAGDTTDRSDDSLAVVTGENTRIASRADAGVGLTLNNVFVRDTEKGNTNIFVKTQSDIAILNRVDLQNGTLTIKQGAASDGRIVVGAGNVLNARAASSLEGRLTGAGDINKSGGDSLLLDYDHSEFTGAIYANGAVGGAAGSVVDDPAANAGSWIEISDAGVGAEASIVLKNTDLVISTDKTRIGTLDTTQDSDVNEKSTGDTLLADGSYTTDGNQRADFTTVGSVLEVNKGKAGDVVQATDMKLSDATLIKLDAEVNGAEVKADTINASGTINAAAVTGLNSTSTAAAPSTARVYIKHADLTAASNAAEGARTTIMTGTMASDINEDVLYDVALSDNGTYQRTLQDRNVHLENKGDHVDLVYSKNYRSAAKDAHLNQVADALKELSDSFHHTEGTLAASSDTMKRLVDAFDYTRSEEAAVRGLRSVAGTGNVLPRLMQFDSSRRHLSALRQQMEMPVCKYAWKGALNRTNNVWMSYTGAYDNLSGDSNMGDYSRNAHGAIVGVDRSLSCKLRAGLSLGYETSTGKADAAKVDADTFFVDAYATGVTGYLKHRASVGLAASSFDYDRNVLVEAGYHTFNGLVKGSTDGLTLNFGYELSSDYHFSERSRMTRYLAVNLAWHQLDAVKEDGLGAVGLITEFEDEWQADLALGVNYIHEFAALRNQKLASFYANAAVHLELLNDRVTATNRLGDTGAGWQTSSMERSPLYFELGAGVVVPLSPTWTGTAGASFEIGPDRYGFSGGVGARYSF